MAAKKKVAKKAAKKAASKKVAKKAAAKKAAAKKTAKSARTAAKKAPAKKVTAKKAPAQKQAKKTASKKAATKKGATKKAAPEKAVSKKPATSKAAVTKKEEVAAAAPKKKAAPPKPVKLTIFVKKQRQRLLDLRDELMDAMYGVQQETLRNGPSGSEASGSGMHQGDAGSDAYDRDFALNLLSKEQDALQEIEAALERISQGYYGICEISGKKIPQARLEAIPFARLTVECQSQWEQEHPNRQFRSSDAVRFLTGNGNAPVSLDPSVD